MREATRQLEAYIQDRFPARQHLIAWLNFARYQLGYSTLSKVVVGKSGWLFYNADGMGHFRGGRRATKAETQAWTAGYLQRDRFSRERGAAFFTLIAPEKPTIHPDKLPAWLRYSGPTATDDFVRAAAELGINTLVDPRGALQARSSPLNYGRYDTHWNGNGAYVAYSQLMTRLAKHDPGLAALPQSAFQPSDLPAWAVPRDMALMLGIADWVKHDHLSYASWPIHDPSRTQFLGQRTDWTAPQIITTDARNQRVLLLIRDSFSLELLPFLKPHFETIILVHSQDGFFRPDLIERYRPSIVLLQIIESGLRHTMAPLPQ
ncbi:MAG TPA: hypothetical protein VGO06_25290 [Bosea sp. (in: a-proteobacteria)]|uniref:alginate O-acetyltransferase AlgX-related protein n=1 Tax=Bosea sp. (in: a-proteobacteria) TaxID=1871050 RepID=UPI002E120DAC|nr:hypothetical protein [Bosea sp. (in: a-proteobacteria)]